MIPATFIVAIIASIALCVWNKRRQEATGKRIPAGWISLVLILGLPLLITVATGVPITWDVPELRGFNLPRWLYRDSGISGAVAGAFHLYRCVHC